MHTALNLVLTKAEEAEVECFDDLNSEKDYRYVWQTTRLHTNY
jgi:hypothetical protein